MSSHKSIKKTFECVCEFMWDEDIKHDEIRVGRGFGGRRYFVVKNCDSCGRKLSISVSREDFISTKPNSQNEG